MILCNTSNLTSSEQSFDPKDFSNNNSLDANIQINNNSAQLIPENIPNPPNTQSNPNNITDINIQTILLHGNDETKKQLFQYKNKAHMDIIQNLIEHEPTFVIDALFPIINKYFLEFFEENNNTTSNNSDESLSLELFDQLILELNEDEANIMLNIININYNKISNQNKPKFINSILLLLNNSKQKERNIFTFMSGCLYLIARHIDNIILNDIEIQLIYFIINKQNDSFTELLLKIILYYIKQTSLNENDIITIQHNFIDKCKINNNTTFNEIKSTIYDKLLSVHSNISTSDEYIENNNNNNASEQYEQFSLFNMTDHLLSYIKDSNEPIHNETLIKSLLTHSKQRLYSIELQNIVNENQTIVNLIFTPFLISKINKISYNKYGKFFAIEIIKHMPQEQIPSLLQNLQPYFIDICTDNEGFKVIQAIIERCLTLYYNASNQSSSLISFLYILVYISSNIIELMTNKQSANANIISYLISVDISLINEILYKIISSNLIQIANNKQGVNKLIYILKLYPKFNYCNYILKQVTSEQNISQLIFDQFGRYLIYFFLENIPLNYNSEIIKYIMNNFIECANHKYSSFIIEQSVLKQGLFSEQMLDVENIMKLATNSIGYHLLISVLQSNTQRISEMKRNLRRIICKSKKAIRDNEIGLKVIKEAQK